MSEKKNTGKKAVIAVIVIALIVVIIALVAVISGKSKKDGSKSATEAGTEAGSETMRSGQFDIDYAKQVTKLADYSGVAITVSNDYEINDVSRRKYLTSVLTSYESDAYTTVTDRDTVEEDDYVKVDYTGYKNGEAFDGGSATDVVLDILGNSQVGGSGFIKGFTTPVIGAKVGDTVKGDVTFPENYGNDDLNGQTVTFEYTIKEIYSPITLADMTDEQVNTVFGKAGVTTNAQLSTQIEKDLNKQLYSAEVNKVKSYMIENSTVEIPDEYLQARLNEYIASFTKENVKDGQTLKKYLKSNYNMTVDQATEKWKENLTDQIKTEFIFGLIAEKENIKMDDDTFNSYVDYIVSASNGQFSKASEVYKYFGSGHKDEGKAYLKNQYLVNKAIDKVTEKANVTFEDGSAAPDTSSGSADAE